MPAASFAPVTSMKRGSGKQQKRSNRAGGTCFTGLIDVRDRESVESWCSEVADRFGKIDCLFSNAGLNARSAVDEMTRYAMESSYRYSRYRRI